MWAWLAGKGAAGFSRLTWIVAIAVVIGTLVLIVNNAVEDTIEVSKEAGAQGAVIAGQETTLDQIGAANEASVAVRGDRSRAKYNECLLGAAEGFESHCERYRPHEPVPD